MAVDLDKVKQTIKALQQRKDALDNERRELEFQLDKLQKEKDELEPQIIEQFGTTEREPLLAKLSELESEVNAILNEAEALQ